MSQEVKGNPLVKIIFLFEDESGLEWPMSTPVPQVEMMADIGRLSAKWGVELDFRPLPKAQGN